MTEDEAKIKWCPFARPASVQPADWGEVRGNRMMDGEADPGARCIASACAAWRLKTFPAHQENIYDQKESPAGDGWRPGSPKATNRWWWRTVPGRITGYCGLAGAPE